MPTLPPAPPELIELPGAVLTRIVAADAEPFAEAVRASFEHLRPWMPWATEQATTVEAQRERTVDAQRQWDEGSAYLFALRPEPAGPVIGTFGLHRRIGADAIEIGYWVHVDHVRRRHASNGAAALTRVALERLGVSRVEIHTDEQNIASASVPRRLGYRLVRVDDWPAIAASETGRLQIWVSP